MNKIIVSLCGLAFVAGVQAADMAVGDVIGVDFGPVANANNFNVLGTEAQKFKAGNWLSQANDSLVNLEGVAMDGVSVAIKASSYFSNDGSEPALGNPPAIYSGENLTDWVGVVEGKDGTLSIIFDGLNDAFAYDLNIGTAFNKNKNVNGTVYSASGLRAVNDNTAQAPNFFDLKGLTTDGSSRLVITVSDSAVPAVSALTLKAVPPGSDRVSQPATGNASAPAINPVAAKKAAPVLVSDKTAAEVAGSKPNFVIIFTDDQGYADLSCFGGKHVYTPNIDKMAAEGARMTSFYVAAPVCTPSRAALMTGCYPARVDMDIPSSLTVGGGTKPFPVCLAGDGRGLNPEELTIAEVAQSAGYKTGMFGKWHLGDQPQFLPTRQGFEEFFGLPYSHDICPTHKGQKIYKFPKLPLLEGETVVEMSPNPNYLTRRITERAVDFIKRNKDESFFLYVAHPLPHIPLAASPEIKKEYASKMPSGAKMSGGENKNGAKKKGAKKTGGKNNMALYSTAVYELDWSVGQILKTLKEQGLDENTVVLFTSDNGPAGNNGSAKPLSGTKTQTLEGGQRVPAVIRWPNVIPAGLETDTTLTAMDVFPTFAKLSGATLPADLVIDGKDMFPALLEGAASPHEYFFYAHWGVLEGVRWKSWKLRVVGGKTTLHNLDNDISEKINVADQHPEIVQQLKAAMRSFEADMKADVRPTITVDNPEPLKK